MRLFEDIIDKVNADSSDEMSSSGVVSLENDDEAKTLKVDRLEDISPEYKFFITISKGLEGNIEKEAERLYDIVESCKSVEEVGKAQYFPNEDLGRLVLKISFNLKSTSDTDVFYLLKTFVQINNLFFNTKTQSRRSFYFTLNGSYGAGDVETSAIFDLNSQSKLCLYNVIYTAHNIHKLMNSNNLESIKSTMKYVYRIIYGRYPQKDIPERFLKIMQRIDPKTILYDPNYQK